MEGLDFLQVVALGVLRVVEVLFVLVGRTIAQRAGLLVVDLELWDPLGQLAALVGLATLVEVVCLLASFSPLQKQGSAKD